MTIEEAVEYGKCSITNERAIEILSRVTLAYEVGKVTVTQAEIQKALDMAIKALEQINCLTGRPCEVCEFHSYKGCRRWKCIFEEGTK